MTVEATPEPPKQRRHRRMPAWFFVLELSYLVLLLAGAIAFARWPAFSRALPHRIGAFPLPVAWWGALGGTLISLEGVFLHNRDWDPAYNYWHIARPLIGAALGSVAYLIFVAVVGATGTKAKTQGANVYYILAFVVGYREETFRNLIKRATDILLGPGHSDKPAGPAGDENC